MICSANVLEIGDFVQFDGDMPSEGKEMKGGYTTYVSLRHANQQSLPNRWRR